MKRLAAALAASAFAAAVVMLLSWTVLFEQLDFLAYDFTMRMAGALPPAAPITIVAIDEESLRRVGRWPWPRQKLAELVAAVGRGEPAVAAIDLVLDEPETPEGDAALSRALATVPKVVLPARILKTDDGERWVRPLQAFRDAGARLGHVHTEPEFDGISRRISSFKGPEGVLIPALSLEVLRAAGVAVDPGFEMTAIPGAAIVREARANIRFAGDTEQTFRTIPAWSLMDGSADAAALRGRMVLIGVTAEALPHDQWFTPFSLSGRRTPGVEIHANAIDTLYARRWIREVPLDVFGLALFVAILGLVWMDLRFEGLRFYAATLLLIPAVVVLSWALMKYANTWLPFPPFVAAIVLVLPGLEVVKVFRVNRNLDAKIATLSRWGSLAPQAGPSGGDAATEISSTLPAGADRDSWLAAAQDMEKAGSRRLALRNRLLGARWRNSRWRLNAVDFFNEELVRFMEFNSAVLGSIEDVILVSDVRGRVVYQNPAAGELDGFEAAPRFAPRYLAALLDGREFAPVFAAVVAGREPAALEFVPGRNGRQFFHVSLAPIGSTGIVVSLHDATAQHELDQAKNEMVSLVSHELRTPLTAIRGYSDMLLKYDLVQDKGKKFLGTIVEESDRLGKLIQSFLDIAYIESGRQKISPTEFEVGPLLRDMAAVLGPVAAARDIRIQADEHSPGMVRADRTLIHQALSNLVTNAIKYSPGGTQVRVTVSNGNDRVSFSVSDQGYGIPPEDLDRIFGKFFRRANAETTAQSGFGLGLAFVKEVAVRHGGEVTVESEIGKGSVFTLQIPL